MIPDCTASGPPPPGATVLAVGTVPVPVPYLTVVRASAILPENYNNVFIFIHGTP